MTRTGEIIHASGSYMPSQETIDMIYGASGPLTIEKIYMRGISVLLAADDVGYPAILKTATGGYDGKRQVKFDKREDILTMIHKSVDSREPTPADLQRIADFAAEYRRQQQGEA